MMDQMGEVEYAPGEPKGTAWHPHRGFETVTYIIDGTFEHQDSHGGGGVITNGDTQWMTAGAGILHIETPPESLVVSRRAVPRPPAVGEPAARPTSGSTPRVPGHRGGEVALLTSHDGGALVRVIAGELGGHAGPGITHTPITLVHATVSPRRAAVAAVAARLQRARLRARPARGTVGAERRPVHTGQAVRLRRGRRDHAWPPTRRQESQPAEPGRRDPRRAADPRADGAWAGPFVMNTKAEVHARRSRTTRRASSA